jgi:hypothetical protein
MVEVAKQKAGHDEVKTFVGDIVSGQQREIDIEGVLHGSARFFH